MWGRKRAGLLTSSSGTEGKNGHENQRAQCRVSRLSGGTALYKRGAAGSKARETKETRTTDASVGLSDGLPGSAPLSLLVEPNREPPAGTGWDPAGRAPGMRVSADKQIAGLEGRTEDMCHGGGTPYCEGIEGWLVPSCLLWRTVCWDMVLRAVGPCRVLEQKGHSEGINSTLGWRPSGPDLQLPALPV